MIPMARLHLAEDTYAELQDHLFPHHDRENEQCAFLFSRARNGVAQDLEIVETHLVPPSGFEVQSPHYLELTDETRAGVIKRAHDLEAGLVEVHTHPGWRTASFSWSDLSGFDEFVPHVMRRLPGRPYLAVVVTPQDFDALVWLEYRSAPSPLEFLSVGAHRMRPTGLTLGRKEDAGHEAL